MAINKSTLRTIDILELLSNHKELTLTEIASAMKIPVTSTADILKGLVDRQMAEISNHRVKTYKIGVKSFIIGSTYLANINIVDIASPFMKSLSEQTKNTVFLAKLVDNNLVYLHKTEATGSFVSTCQIGSKAGFTFSSLGKVILAHNQWLQDKIFAEPLPKITEHTISDPSRLKAQLAEILVKGYAQDKFENDERTACVGFPIFDQKGNVEHSISISGGYSHFRDMGQEIELGKVCAKEISARLGYVDR